MGIAVNSIKIRRTRTGVSLIGMVVALAGPVPALADLPGAMHQRVYGPTLDGSPLAATLSAPLMAAPPAPEAPPMAASPAQEPGNPPAPAKPMAAARDEPPADAVESLRAAIVGALKDNPEIQITLAQQDDAQFAVDEARAAYLPHLDVSAGRGREVARAGHTARTIEWRLESTATLTQNLWDFGITINDIRRARAAWRSAEWATREKIESISYDITNAYLGVLQQQKLVALTEAELAATQKILKVVTVQKDLGLTTSADISRVKTRIEAVQSDLLDRKSALEQARHSYRRLTNHLPATAVDLPDDAAMLPATVEDAVDLIDQHNPSMAQAVEDLRSLARQYDSQTGSFFPRVSLLVQGNHKFDVQGATGLADDARAMVQVTYNLFNGGADRALRRRIAARMREADYELDRRRRQVETDIRTDFDALEAARKKIATIGAQIDAADRVAGLYKDQFKEGKRTVFDLLDSEQNLYSARAAEITNRIALQAAEYRVLQNLGGLFDLISQGEPLPDIAQGVDQLNASRAAAKAASPDPEPPAKPAKRR